MRELYLRSDVPAYLNATARRLLAEGRDTFMTYRLDTDRIRPAGNSTHIIAFRGDLILDTISVMLHSRNVRASNEQSIVSCDGVAYDNVIEILSGLASVPLPDPLELAATIKSRQRDKHDVFIGEDLLIRACAARDLDVAGAAGAIREIISARSD